MTVTLAEKYSKQVDERFKLKSLTNVAVAKEGDGWDWDGVNSIKVYGVTTYALGNYDRVAASNRYGLPSEADNTVTTYALARDRAFSKIIDRRNKDASMGVMEAGKWLARQQDEQVTPEIDIFRLAAWKAATPVANTIAEAAGAKTTSSNAYQNFLTLQERISDKLVPLAGRIAFMTNQYYTFLKLSGFVLPSEKSQEARGNGNLGTVDGNEVVVVPSSYMPTNTDLLIVHPTATASPMVLEDFNIHDNPPGINGNLIEGRVVYDAFVLANKVNALAAHVNG